MGKGPIFQSSCGKAKFITTANNAVGATADVASVFQMPGKYWTALGTKFKPRPTARETEIMIMLRRDIFTSVSMFMPAATTIPNITITPPPKTGKGIDEIMAPIFGINPQIIKITPAMVTT